jgi:protein TonB
MSPRPDVLTEATDLDTLFEAIVGRTPSGVKPTIEGEDEHPDEPPGEHAGIDPPPDPLAALRSLERRASPVSASFPEPKPVAEPPRLEAHPTPLLSSISIGQMATGAQTPEEPHLADDDRTAYAAMVQRLRVMRTSPWPVMVIVGGMALVTVSAIGLRSGTSLAKVEPPLVAPPPPTLPSEYTAQLPAAPLTPTDRQLAPPSTAFGDSPWRPAAPAAGNSATVAPPPTTPAPAIRSASASAPPTASPSDAMATAEPAAASPPASRTAEPVAETSPEARVETPTPTSTPPAVSSARPSTAGVVVNEAVPELPKPVTPRNVSVVAARRLTGGMPEYSAPLRQRKLWGVVDVVLKIDVKGRVISANAVSGPLPLRRAAVAAVLKWQYMPATRNGVPIETESKVTFTFDPSKSLRP